jgi:hypothetical protein
MKFVTSLWFITNITVGSMPPNKGPLFQNHHMGPADISVKHKGQYKKDWDNKKNRKKIWKLKCLCPTKKDLMQCLQDACAVFIYDSVAKQQMLVPAPSCLPPFVPPPIQVTTKERKVLWWTVYLNFGILVPN